jgi:hypothetical protein
MARNLELSFHQHAIAVGMNKVDRSTLYGAIDIETRDRDGVLCTIATLASDGQTLVPSGGTALGYISPEGRWLERKELVAVDNRGNRINAAASSFDSPIVLETTTTPDRFLDHAIRSSYALDPVEPLPPALSAELDGGTIFKFDFSYRGGTRPDPAFLLKGADDVLWLLIGSDSNLNFVGLTQAAGLADVDGPEPAEDDELDFAMM